METDDQLEGDPRDQPDVSMLDHEDPSTNTLHNVPKLEKDFSNTLEWEAALRRYAKDNRWERILEGTQFPPQHPELGIMCHDLTALCSAQSDDASLMAALGLVRRHNRDVVAEFEREEKIYASFWDGHKALSDVIFHTVDFGFWDPHLADVERIADQVAVTLSTYHQRAYETWYKLKTLCTDRDQTPADFVAKFKAAMVKLDRFERYRLTEEQKVFQFLHALRPVYVYYVFKTSNALVKNMTLDKLCRDFILDQSY